MQLFFSLSLPLYVLAGKIPEILDYGCGDGSLMSWAFQPEVLAEDGPREVTLVESNQELVERARQKLPHADVRLTKEGAVLDSDCCCNSPRDMYNICESCKANPLASWLFVD